MTDYMTVDAAAHHLGIKTSYLKRQMSAGTGPRYVRPSPRLALFTPEDLDAWKKTWVVPHYKSDAR